MNTPRPLQDRYATLARIRVDGKLRACVVLRNDGHAAYVRLIGEQRYIACGHAELFEFPEIPICPIPNFPGIR